MGKRKGRPETLNNHSNGEDDDDSNGRSEDDDGEKSGFYACYLLTSLCPRFKGHTYIGFTVNPRRRIRQHNGEICSGASRTKKKRPWEMVLCIHGFPTNVAALQFEWAWQHPVESLAVRKAAVAFKSLGGLANKIKLAYTMLTLPAWNNLDLTVNFFSTKYTKHYAGCPSLPSHMRVHVRSMDELPCYTQGYTEGEDDMFRSENYSWDDDEEPERAVGSYDSIPVPVSKEATCLLDIQEQPSCSNHSPGWFFLEKSTASVVDVTIDDDEEERERAVCDSKATIPVLVSVETTCVLDIEDDHEQPSCSNHSPGWLFSNTPKRSTVSVVDVTMEDDNVKMDGGTRSCTGVAMAADIDRPRNKISSSSGEVEVIDLFTPSPELRTKSPRTKSRISVICPEIIDLTQSPIYV